MSKCSKALKVLFDQYRQLGWMYNGMVLADHSRFGNGVFARDSNKYISVTCTENETRLVVRWSDRADPRYRGPEVLYPIAVLYRGSLEAARDAIYKMIAHFEQEFPLSSVDPSTRGKPAPEQGLARRSGDRACDAAELLDRFQIGQWTFTFEPSDGLLWLLPPVDCGIAGVLFDTNTSEFAVVLTEQGKDRVWDEAREGAPRVDWNAHYQQLLDVHERSYVVQPVTRWGHFRSVDDDARTLAGAMISFTISHPSSNLCPDGIQVLLNETRSRR